ncbi:hypothetical protein D9615_004920 [Tricholomella constricta]|uniref:DUF6589 domain-containing protein n=1 Tax=Tricholomella constricta TaxID=117010 RepID=A0A8H5HGP1_9AGAR|nr:hypothetical protein D9615_004920 [Tricholomella constricta]
MASDREIRKQISTSHCHSFTESPQTIYNIIPCSVMATETSEVEARDIAEGPHMLHIDRATGSNGSKKLSASLLTLCNAKPEDMRLTPIIDRRAEVSSTGTTADFSVDDLLPNAEQRASLLHQAAILAVQALTSHVDGFKKYADLPLFQFTPRRPLPEDFRTRTAPVAATLGAQYTPARHAALIREAYLTKLKLNERSFEGRAIPCINDAATNNSIRRIQMAACAVPDSTPLQNLFSLQFGPGLADIIRKMVKQVIKNHCPHPNANEGLAKMFRVINKGHLAQGNPQDHEAALSALDTILMSSFLECWRLNCGFDSTDDYAASNPDPADILDLAKKIVIKHAKRIVPKQPQRFKDDHKYSAENSDVEEGDMVYRNQRLLLRSLIYISLLKRAIADGDFGRIEDFLGIICVSMVGAGKDNTAHEIKHFLFDLKHVWSENFGNIMRDSMIVNFFKKGSNAMPADISAPHLANYSRFLYAAHGFENEWRAPRNMAEAIALIDAFDEKLEIQGISERIAGGGECQLM